MRTHNPLAFQIPLQWGKELLLTVALAEQSPRPVFTSIGPSPVASKQADWNMQPVQVYFNHTSLTKPLPLSNTAWPHAKLVQLLK